MEYEEIRCQLETLEKIFGLQRSMLIKLGIPLDDYDFLVAQQLVIASPYTDHNTKLSAFKKYEERIQKKPNITGISTVDSILQIDILEIMRNYLF